MNGKKLLFFMNCEDSDQPSYEQSANTEQAHDIEIENTRLVSFDIKLSDKTRNSVGMARLAESGRV